MIFKEIRIGELESYVKSKEFTNSKILPITSHRAFSQINNPRSDKDDVCLILAINEDEIVGYIGVLPDLIQGDQKEKVGWNSCWWVDPEKGKVVAMPLFYKALEEWDNKMLFADLTPHTKMILEKSGDKYYTETTIGVRGFARFNFAEILSNKNSFLKKTTFLLAIVDRVANLFISNSRNLIWSKKSILSQNYEMVSLKEFDRECEKFIGRHNPNELIRRGVNELNWILKHPWVKEKGHDPNNESSRYFFSLEAKEFKFHFLKILHSKVMVGLLLFSERDKNFKLPYCYFEKKYESVICKVIYQILLEKKANTFTTYNPTIKNYILKNSSPFLYKKLTPKYFALTTTLKESFLKNPNIQDGDGDVVFT